MTNLVADLRAQSHVGLTELRNRAADEIERLRAKTVMLRGILDRLVMCDTSTELGQIITGKAAVEAAREYVAEKRNAHEPAPLYSPTDSDDTPQRGR